MGRKFLRGKGTKVRHPIKTSITQGAKIENCKKRANVAIK